MKRKSTTRCMADGGVVRESAEEMLKRMNAKYGLGDAGKPAPQPTPSPPPQQPAPAPQTSSQGGLVGTIGRRNEELKKAANYATGGAIFGDDYNRPIQAPQIGFAPQVASYLSGVQDATTPATPKLGASLSQSAAAPGLSPQSQGILGGLDYGTTPAQLANSGKPGFVWEDGTPRDLSRVQQQMTQDTKQGTKQGTAQNLQTGPEPLMTMKERDIAAGLDPSRSYTPGTASDPHASGLSAGGQTIYDQRQQRNRYRHPYGPEYADGGIIPVGIIGGLKEAIVDPIVSDWKQGNVAIKAARDKNPVVDAMIGIHPGVAAAQVANDMMAGDVGADTAGNVAQMIPIMKRASILEKGSVAVPGFGRFAVNMPATIKKNTALTAAQTLGQPANAFSDGGMVRFAGKGGPREDKIPVTVAGDQINVSDGEAAVILPAKTAANREALGIIGGVIEATNDGRKPKMGVQDGGRYASGAIPDEEALRRAGGQIGNPLTIYGGIRPPTAQEIYGSGPKAAVTVPPGTVGGDLTASGRYGEAVPGGSITQIAPALRQIHEFAKPAYDLTPSMRALGTTAKTIGNVFADSATAQQQGTTYSDARAARIAEEEKTKVASGMATPDANYGNEGRPSALSSIYSSFKPQPAAQQPQDSGAQQLRDGITQTNMGRGFDPTKLEMAPGYGMASNAAGKTLSIGPSQYVAADGSPTSRWEDTKQYQDAIARNEADKLRLAEMQSQRLGADPMAIQASRQGIAGAVLNNRAKQAEMQRNDYIQSLVAKAAAETDPAKQRAIIEAALAAQGKDARQFKNLHVIDLGEDTVTDQMGAVKTVERGQALYDADTKRVIPISIGGQAGTQKAPDAETIKREVAAGIAQGKSKSAMAERLASMGLKPGDFGL